MENKKDHKELSDLLNQKDRSQLDDFEKEAIEGFDMLSGEEAFQLKEELDAEMEQKVFKPKKQNPRIFLLAAASLVLVIGLSVLFVLNNSGLEEKTGLAINAKTEENSLPEAAKMTPAPAESPAEIGSLEKNKESGAKESLNKVTKEQSLNEAEKRSEGKPITVTDEQNGSGVAQKTKDIVVEESKESSALDDIRNDNAKSGEEAPKKGIAKAADREQSPSEDKKSENFKDQLSSDTKAVPATGSAESNLARSSKEKARKKSRSSVAGKQDTEPSQQQERDEDISLAASENEAEKKNESKLSPSAPTYEAVTSGKNSGPGNISFEYQYKSGEKELMKDLSNKLNSEEVNVAFDAELLIDKKGKVEKVNIYNANGLSNKKVNAIERILKDLEAFSVPANAKGLYKYKLNYRP